MTADFYICKDDNRTVNKSNLKQTLTNIDITFKDDVSILSPILITQYNINIAESNYIYIRDLNRYYYIKNIDYSQQRIILYCECDVLNSYKNDIYNLTCIIKKQESFYNLYLNDGTFKAYQDPLIYCRDFPNGLTANELILTIAGS